MPLHISARDASILRPPVAEAVTEHRDQGLQPMQTIVYRLVTPADYVATCSRDAGRAHTAIRRQWPRAMAARTARRNQHTRACAREERERARARERHTDTHLYMGVAVDTHAAQTGTGEPARIPRQPTQSSVSAPPGLLGHFAKSMLPFSSPRALAFWHAPVSCGFTNPRGSKLRHEPTAP